MCRKRQSQCESSVSVSLRWMRQPASCASKGCVSGFKSSPRNFCSCCSNAREKWLAAKKSAARGNASKLRADYGNAKSQKDAERIAGKSRKVH